MKSLFWIIVIIILVVLVGTWPLSVLEIVFNAIATAFGWLAKALNFFGWNGLV